LLKAARIINKSTNIEKSGKSPIQMFFMGKDIFTTESLIHIEKDAIQYAEISEYRESGTVFLITFRSNILKNQIIDNQWI